MILNIKILFICSSYLIILILFPLKIFSLNCDSIKFPRECHCQRSRQLTHEYPDKIRLKCRQINFLKKNFSSTNISFDRLIFETTNDNLTLTNSILANLNTRILRFHVENLFLQKTIFKNATIGQLLITNDNAYAGINFDNSNSSFSHSIIDKLELKSIDFQNPIVESIFSNSIIQTLTIQSSKFYGFHHSNSSIFSNSIIQTLTIQSSKFYGFHHSNSSKFSLKIFSIISSLNLTNLTDNYLPQNLEQSQFEQINFLDNQISHLNAFVFHSFERFTGKLNLENNRILSIDSNAFRRLFSIKILSLKKNLFKQIPKKLFIDCQQLTNLDLSFNQLNSFEKNLFDNLEQLEILILNHNPIEFIHSETFLNLKQLKQIHFEHVHILQQDSISWLWNLANSNVIHLLKTE